MVALVVLVDVVLAGVDAVAGGPQPSGPGSSSYATVPQGVAAYAALLAQSGHPVSRYRGDLAPAPASWRRSTVVLLDPGEVSDEEARALRDAVRSGGRLITGDFGGDLPLTRILLREAPVWRASTVRLARPVVPVVETTGVRSVRSDGGRGAWRSPGSALPVLAGRNGALALVAQLGLGKVVLLADTTLLTNQLLATADNAVFALNIAGEPGRPVVFDEAVHGYGTATGLAALPPSWKWALTGLFVALLVFMVASARRLGPPESARRELPPPRRAYVDAVAATLARTGAPDTAMAPARRAARALVVRRAGLAPDASDAEIARAAHALGLDIDETAGVLGSTGDPLAVARAVAHLSGART
jgi:hypothetical protein